MKISANKSIFSLFAIPVVLVLGYWASLHEVVSDTEVYYLFYRSLINNGLIGVRSFQSFEPLFAVISYVISYITQSEQITHYLWSVLYFFITLKALLLLWPNNLTERRYSFLALICFILASINYTDPQIVYFLTRQYVASSFIVLAIALITVGKSPVYALIFASLIHFGSVPISCIIYLFSRRSIFRWDWKSMLLVVVILVLVLVLFLGNSYLLCLFDMYYNSIKYKFVVYADRNNGNVTFLQEVKLFLYWLLAAMYFKVRKVQVVKAFILIYVLYLFTFSNDMAHLRYYKYLESMSWPSLFMLSYFGRKSSLYLYASFLCFRIYKYLTIIAPEASLVYLIKSTVMSAVLFVSSLFV